MKINPVLNATLENGKHEMDMVHDAMKIKFLSRVDAHGLTIARSTTDLTTAEAEEYYENIRRWAASDLNIVLPTPNEVPYTETNESLRA